MKKLLIFGLALLFCFCAQEEQTEAKDVVDLAPLDNELSTWVRSSAMDIAENATQLYDFINGEGWDYTENGFVKFVRQWYEGDISSETRQLKLRIFDMGDTTNAKNIYDIVGTGIETPWTDNNAGVDARIDETLLFDYKINFWDDRFCVDITIYDEKTPAGLNVAKSFALNVSAAIRE